MSHRFETANAVSVFYLLKDFALAKSNPCDIYNLKKIDIHIFYTYNISMNYQYNLKPVTLYVGAQLYEDYQIQAQKQGRKTAELIRNAMQDYADEHFKTKKSLKDIDFSRGVSLRAGASDFLSDDSWKDDFISGGIKL